MGTLTAFALYQATVPTHGPKFKKALQSVSTGQFYQLKCVTQRNTIFKEVIKEMVSVMVFNVMTVLVWHCHDII